MARIAWEQQEGESKQAFRAWVMYRDMGDEGTYDQVAKGLGKSLTLICGWGSKWQWQHRMELYRNHLDGLRRKKQEKDRMAMLDRHATIARAAQSKIAERLVNLTADKIPVQSIAPLLETTTKMERLALGMSTDKIEAAGKVQQSVVLDDRLLTDPVARKLACELTEQLANESADGGPEPGSLSAVREHGTVENAATPGTPQPEAAGGGGGGLS